MCMDIIEDEESMAIRLEDQVPHIISATIGAEARAREAAGEAAET